MTAPQSEASPPWPTCERKGKRCQLSSEIMDIETELNRLQTGIDALFNLLEGCSFKNSPTELELESGYFFAFTFNDTLKILRGKWEGLHAAAGDETENNGPALAGRSAVDKQEGAS